MRKIRLGNGAELDVEMCAQAGPALVIEIPGPRDVLDVATYFSNTEATARIEDRETVHEGFTRLYGVTKTGLAADDPILVTMVREDE
jgi:hypothetical protein